jgi:hypothetical protein
MDSDPTNNEITTLPNATTIAAGGAGAGPAAAGDHHLYADGSILILPAIDFAKPIPQTLIFVVDVSGSMDSNVKPEDPECRFSRLDLVKHALLTAVSMMGMNDSIAMITFSDAARTVVPLTKMTAAHKPAIESTIRALRTEGGTRLWNGLATAFALAATQKTLVHIAVLTDGATEQPLGPGSLLTAVKSALAKSLPPLALSTFGFGYGVESPLLVEISRQKHGFYGFIPDSSMVGTIIVNYMSNALATIDYDELFGPLQASQQREIRASPTGSAPALPAAADRTIMTARFAYIEAVAIAHIHATHRRFADAQGILVAFHKSHRASTHPFVKGLCLDIESDSDGEGQVGKAVQKAEWFDKWGCHYLPSVIRAHELQICSNFKDCGVQLYASDLFKSIQKQGAELFISLPAPPGSIAHKASAGSGGSHYPAGVQMGAPARAPAAPVSMAAYYNPSGGCFHGDAQIALADGTSVSIRAVRPGTQVKTLDGIATVFKMIRYTVPSGFIELAGWITPYHPIQRGGAWVFPCDYFPTTNVATDAVYNFVLDTTHHVLVNDVVCCTLAHGIKGNIIEHAYFGTDKVLEDLAARPDWNTSYIVYKNPRWINDPATGLICKTIEVA